MAGIARWGLGGLLAGAAVTAVVLLLALWAGRRLLRSAHRHFRWRAGWLAGRERDGGRSTAGRRCEPVGFYVRLEALLARYGVRRKNHETQREFALTAVGRLAGAGDSGRAASLAGGIVDAFYRVRFGRHPLPENQSRAVEAAVGELDRTLADREEG